MTKEDKRRKETRAGNTYYMIIKGSKEVKFDELHLLTFCTNGNTVRSRFEVPKNSIKYNSKLEKTLNEYIKIIVEYSIKKCIKPEKDKWK